MRVLLLAWLFLVFFLFFFSRYKILKYECKTYNIDKKLDYLGIILMIIHAHLTRLSVCSSCIREMKRFFPIVRKDFFFILAIES